MLKDKVIFSN